MRSLTLMHKTLQLPSPAPVCRAELRFYPQNIPCLALPIHCLARRSPRLHCSQLQARRYSGLPGALPPWNLHLAFPESSGSQIEARGSPKTECWTPPQISGVRGGVRKFALALGFQMMLALRNPRMDSKDGFKESRNPRMVSRTFLEHQTLLTTLNLHMPFIQG